MSLSFRIVVLIAVFFSAGVNGFWRMNCGIIQRGRIDPLVSYGAIASHSHSILGGSNIGINATSQSLLDSDCTSCEIGADRSAYWSPDLYYQYSDGSFYEVPHDGGVVYYLGRGPNVQQTIPFPKGLMMLSGKMTARSYDNTTYTWGNATYPGRPVADRVSFVCLDSSGTFPQTPNMARTQCSNGMRAQIQFQSCWNGVDLYKADNSHVAYLSQIDNGICPPTHPWQLPHLFMERLYSVANVPNMESGGRFVFAQGDPTGYGFHGDFQNGWDAEVLQAAVNNCLYSPETADGVISECPVLQASQSDSYRRTCPEQPPQIGEPVTGLLQKLPGCIKITTGPADATPDTWTCPSGYVQPSVTPTADSTPRPTRTPSVGSSLGISNYQKYLGCFTDNGIRTLKAASTTNTTGMSVDYCQSWCQARGYRLSGVEYGQECYCDNSILATAQASQGCTFTCSGTTFASGFPYQEMCGGSNAINIYNNTDPAFGVKGSASSTISPSTLSTSIRSSSTLSTSGASSSQTSSSAPLSSKASSTTSSSSKTSSTKPSSTAVSLSPLPTNYVGCATDSNGSARALGGSSTAGADMTIDKCKTFCAQGAGYQFYGLEYSSQCFCGNSLTAGNIMTNLTSTPTNATCNMRCSGAKDQICGGPNAISLFNSTTYVSPKTKPTIGSYVNRGCLTDPMAAGGGRALQGASVANNTMTADVCVNFCQGKKMAYAGVEYGQECYCGNAIASGSGATATACDASRLMTCAGDPKQYCGGSNLITLYYAGSA